MTFSCSLVKVASGCVTNITMDIRNYFSKPTSSDTVAAAAPANDLSNVSGQWNYLDARWPGAVVLVLVLNSLHRLARLL